MCRPGHPCGGDSWLASQSPLFKKAVELTNREHSKEEYDKLEQEIANNENDQGQRDALARVQESPFAVAERRY